jgi:hypothetical protein
MHYADPKFRPDNCGVIFERLSDNVFHALTKNELSYDAEQQIAAFIQQGFSVILTKVPHEAEPTIYGGAGMNGDDVLALYKDKVMEKASYGNA